MSTGKNHAGYRKAAYVRCAIAVRHTQVQESCPAQLSNEGPAGKIGISGMGIVYGRFAPTPESTRQLAVTRFEERPVEPVSHP